MAGNESVKQREEPCVPLCFLGKTVTCRFSEAQGQGSIVQAHGTHIQAVISSGLPGEGGCGEQVPEKIRN